jgi:hypothetical protein
VNIIVKNVISKKNVNNAGEKIEIHQRIVNVKNLELNKNFQLMIISHGIVCIVKRVMLKTFRIKNVKKFHSIKNRN